jgi:hypothetical protein
MTLSETNTNLMLLQVFIAFIYKESVTPSENTKLLPLCLELRMKKEKNKP